MLIVTITFVVIDLVVFVSNMTGCRYGLSAPEEASESVSASAIDEEADGDDAAASASGRRHLSAKERKLMKKQVSAEVLILKFGLSASKTKLPQGPDGSTSSAGLVCTPCAAERVSVNDSLVCPT